MTAPDDPVQAQLGDNVYLGTRLVNMHFYGVVSDIDTPSGATATMELVGDDAVVTMDALVGPKGNPGKSAPIVKMQYGANIEDPADLPDNLKNTEADIGKAWWIGNQVYVWTGTGWEQNAMGTAGPAGPVPNITPTIESIPWEEQEAGRESEVTVTGTAANPGWHFAIAAPRGPQGPSTNILNAPDFDRSSNPRKGQVIVWNGTKFQAQDPNPYVTRMYTVPESSFKSVPLAIGSKVIICTFEVPPQPQDFTIWVVGHMRVKGFEANIFDPFLITSEVRVALPNNDPKGGVLIGRGFGNNSQIMTIQPHASTPQSPSDAISPTNGSYGRFAAGQTYTMSVMLQTSGLLGVYNFEPRDAQLAFQVIPV